MELHALFPYGVYKPLMIIFKLHAWYIAISSSSCTDAGVLVKAKEVVFQKLHGESAIDVEQHGVLLNKEDPVLIKVVIWFIIITSKLFCILGPLQLL